MFKRCAVLAGGLVFCLASASAADRAAVEAVLEKMEKAVLAGDKAGYMTFVSDKDAIFHKEQENWAADFDHHVPIAFDLEISKPKGEHVEEFGEAEARFELKTTWTIAEGKPERVVSFPVVFAADGDGGAWRYRGEDWVSIAPQPANADAPAGTPGESGMPVHGGTSLCKCYPGFEEAARAVVAVLPEIRAHVDTGFETSNTDLVEVKIYPSMKHLQHSIYLSYEDGLAGWNEPGESIKVLASRHMNQDYFRPLLAHEYGHVNTFRMGPQSNDMAWWILEGVAELSAERYSGDGIRVQSMLLRWSKNGNLAPWEEMADFRKTPDKYMTHVYKQGQHMLGFISNRWERQGRNRWLTLMSNGASLDEATRQVMGMTFSELDTLWRESLVEAPAVPATPSPPAPDGPPPPPEPETAPKTPAPDPLVHPKPD